MEVKTVAEINQYTGSSLNPLEYPEQLYELYSVPSFENGYPEIIRGKEIGSTKITVEEGDVLVCKINPRINRVWVVKHHTEYPLLASSEWIVVRNGEIDSNYLKWYFTSPTFRTLLNSQVAGIGGSLTRAQPKQVAKYPIPVPTVAEQQNISKILDKIDRLINLRKEQLAKLDQLVKSRFIELFGDPVQNPFKWDTKPLLEMGYCKNGMNFHTGDSGIEMHCLGVGDFKDYSVIDGTDHLPTISLNETPPAESMLQNGDIVFVRSNGNKALVGRCLVVYPHDTPTTYSGFCIRYRLTSDEVNTAYLLRVLKTESMRKKMAGRGANIQNLNQKILASLNIPIPPMAQQAQFAAFVEQTDKSKMAIQQSLDKLELLKKALMQEYFG